MAWAKVETQTLGSTGDDITTPTFTEKKFVNFFSHMWGSGNVNLRLRLNGSSSATVYGDRFSVNGGADSTIAPNGDGWINAEVNLTNNDYDKFIVGFIMDVASEEKLLMFWNCDRNASGAANAPNRLEGVSKFVPSPTARVTSITIRNGNTGDYAIGSNVSVLGSELTPASAKTIETGSIYIDTDTNQRYFWNGSSWSLQA